MTPVRRVLSIVVAVMLTVLATASARAATPTPTGTPTSTATPTATATPSPEQIARFTGEKWADAKISSDIVTARIGDVVCGTEEVWACTDCAPMYRINVVSDRVTPGCGREGATINFFVGNREASQTAVWHAASHTTLNLTAGPSFALMSGSTSLTCDQRIGKSLIPFVGGVPCGQEKPSDGLGPPCNGQLVNYTAVVLSAQQQAGCGVEGAEVTFKIVDSRGNVISVAQQTGVWHAWDGVSAPQQLNLTFAPANPIRIGNVGDGPESAANPWLPLSVGLASLALAVALAGLALRKPPAK